VGLTHNTSNIKIVKIKTIRYCDESHVKLVIESPTTNFLKFIRGTFKR